MWYQLEEDSLLYGPVFAIFLICLGGSFFFTVSHLTNLITSFRAIHLEGTPSEIPDAPKPGVIDEGCEPHVTIVICAYNEGIVVPKTLEKACQVDWPRDKLTIQVCDDSTNTESIMLIDKAVAYWKSKGMDVDRLTRPDRVGYKAGSLRYHFHRTKGEYVAYFDADHRPEKDYLRNMLPYFYDEDGKTIEKRGLVQAPWAFHNTHQSLLAECGKYLFVSMEVRRAL